MKSIRLIGNFGENDGIVIFRSSNASSIWVVELDKTNPTNLNLAKMKQQLR